MPWKETCAMEERLKRDVGMDLKRRASVSELSRCYGVSRKDGEHSGEAGISGRGLRDFWTRAVRRIVHPQGLSDGGGGVGATSFAISVRRGVRRRSGPTWVDIDRRFGGRPTLFEQHRPELLQRRGSGDVAA